ncbi:MAG: bifunctional methylenetetrahydrofolate dehydrogenase/methenyltetrahydrofolate cyclohydrolase FolD [Bdellovibrionales bacterium]
MVKLDGREVSKTLREKMRSQVSNFQKLYGKIPGLAVVLVGNDPASHVYVGNKEKGCAEIGIKSFRYDLPADASFEKVKELVQTLNSDPHVHGILIQLPLPKHLPSEQITELINVKKDADGLTTGSMGLLWTGQPRVKPCTPHGVMKILEHYKIPTSGREAVVVGRSQIVGKPMAQLLMDAQATVTICHSKTKDLRSHTRRADIVVVAAGQPRLLGKEDFKKEAVVIDVGIHKLESGKLCGDVRFDELEGWASAATPVPGGVGPMTITMLLQNTILLAELSMKEDA